MLSLTMRKGDYLVLGGNVRLTFDRQKGAAEIYFSIDAPREVKVLRGEVYERQIIEEAERNGDKAAIERLTAENERRQRELAKRREARRLEMLDLQERGIIPARGVRRVAISEQGAGHGAIPEQGAKSGAIPEHVATERRSVAGVASC